MKAYILYIATLLAALALPLAAQTGVPVTKAVPDDPVMPYRLTTAITGSAHGEATLSTQSGTGAFAPLGEDSLAYGASPNGGKPNPNADSVKLAITPDAGYVIRDGYPKAYKTGDTESGVSLTPEADEDGARIHAFRMPAHPVTVEIAYALPVEKVADITLKAPAAGEAEAIALLPAYIHVTLANGQKDSLAVASTGGWTFKASGVTGDGTSAYDIKPGAANRFTATLAALPDSIDKGTALSIAGETYTAEVRVANQAEALKPTAPDKGLIILPGTGDNLNGKTGDEEVPFNGTIESAEVPSLEVNGEVKDVTLTLKDVTVSGGSDPEGSKTEVKSGADLTLRIEGTNNLGTLAIGTGATVVLDKAEGAKLEVTTVSNHGTFRDSTATITAVTGHGALSISGTLSGGGSVTPNTAVALTASCSDKDGITTFIWQRRKADGSYTETQKNKYNDAGAPIQTRSGTAPDGGITDTYRFVTSTDGISEYRCLIERTVTTPAGEGGGEATTATTLLSTRPAKVEVRSGSDPEPATSYTVTLPALEGFTSEPAPGQHSVEEGYDFSFALTPAAGNTAPAPIVTTSRGETIQPRPGDGLYVISRIYEDITVRFTSLPTANETINTEGIRIQGVSGAVHIQTPHPATATVYTLSGSPVKQLGLSAGDSRVELPAGIYIIRVGNESRKAIVR